MAVHPYSVLPKKFHFQISGELLERAIRKLGGLPLGAFLRKKERRKKGCFDSPTREKGANGNDVDELSLIQDSSRKERKLHININFLGLLPPRTPETFM